MDASARDRNVDLVEFRPPFPLGSSRSRRTAIGRRSHGTAVECGTSVQIMFGRLLGRKGTRGTSSARSGTTCLSRLPTHTRGIRAGQAEVQDTVQEGARERWRSEDSQVARASAAVSLGDTQPEQAAVAARHRDRQGI